MAPRNRKKKVLTIKRRQATNPTFNPPLDNRKISVSRTPLIYRCSFWRRRLRRLRLRRLRLRRLKIRRLKIRRLKIRRLKTRRRIRRFTRNPRLEPVKGDGTVDTDGTSEYDDDGDGDDKTVGELFPTAAAVDGRGREGGGGGLLQVGWWWWWGG